MNAQAYRAPSLMGSQPAREERYLPVTEAAMISGMHPQSIYRLISKGVIPGYGRVNMLRVRLSDLLPQVEPRKTRQRSDDGSRARAALAKSHAAKVRREPGITEPTDAS